MKVFLIRHGNTFGEDQIGGNKVFLCGSKNNIPLVNMGRQKARDMARFLEMSKISAIYASPLIRTWEHATIIREHLIAQNLANDISLPLYPREELVELDYGNWAGLATDGNSKETNEVIAKFGEQAWHDWQQKRIIPNHHPHNWQITKDEIINRVKGFFNMLCTTYQNKETVVVISSQGVITFVNELFSGGMEQAIKEHRLKVSPGNYCEIELLNDKFKLISWNQPI